MDPLLALKVKVTTSTQNLDTNRSTTVDLRGTYGVASATDQATVTRIVGFAPSKTSNSFNSFHKLPGNYGKQDEKKFVSSYNNNVYYNNINEFPFQFVNY